MLPDSSCKQHKLGEDIKNKTERKHLEDLLETISKLDKIFVFEVVNEEKELHEDLYILDLMKEIDQREISKNKVTSTGSIDIYLQKLRHSAFPWFHAK